MEHRSRFAARHQLRIVLIGAVGEHLIDQLQSRCLAGADQRRIWQHDKIQVWIDGSDGSGNGTRGHVVGASDIRQCAVRLDVGDLVTGQCSDRLQRPDLVGDHGFDLGRFQSGDRPPPDEGAVCGVRKDAGDDPDVTDGIVVVSTVAKTENNGICIDGGGGVGRVTKPGLDQPVGAAAINSVPRRMIEEQARSVAKAFAYDGGLAITISVPGGADVARQTFNPNLGVVDGISILGTSGIEEPMSESALVQSIELELSQARATGYERVVLVPGNYAEAFICDSMRGLADTPQVKFSNYLGDALDAAAELGFTDVLVVGHIGKLVKLAGGIMNTHSRVADCRLELLCCHAALCGADATLCASLMQAATTDAALDLLHAAGLKDAVVASLLKSMQGHLDRRANEAMRVGAVVFSNQYGLLGITSVAQKIIAAWEVSL